MTAVKPAMGIVYRDRQLPFSSYFSVTILAIQTGIVIAWCICGLWPWELL